jgi:hypothetical protein
MQLFIIQFSPASWYIVCVNSDTFLRTNVASTLILSFLNVIDQVSHALCTVCGCVLIQYLAEVYEIITTEFFQQIISIVLFILTRI